MGTPIASEADLEELIAAIRVAGLAQTDSLLYAGFVGISAPILNHETEICCSLTIMGPQGTFDASMDGPAAHALRRQTGELCARLGVPGQEDASREAKTLNKTLKPGSRTSHPVPDA
jgi:DNA-binding IclR family transcriptional regulator